MPERHDEADLAAIARRKANERRHIAAIAGTIEYVHPKPDLSGMLPEAAFDWPIYRAATGTAPDRCTVPGCDGLLATLYLCDGHAEPPIPEGEARALDGDR